MCVALFALDAVPGWPLILLANRDEWHARPAEALAWWTDRPDVAGGRDTTGGGTWLAARRDGRFAAVLNDARIPGPPDAPSRGGLVPAVLAAESGASVFGRIHEQRDDYAGFHLLAGQPGSGWYVGSRAAQPRSLGTGLHAVGNAGLEPDDPRLRRARGQFERRLRAAPDPGGWLDLLADTTDPGAGAGDDRPLFVVGDEFGTRCSTVFLLAEDGHAHLHERRYDAGGRAAGDSRLHWRIEPPHGGGGA